MHSVSKPNFFPSVAEGSWAGNLKPKANPVLGHAPLNWGTLSMARGKPKLGLPTGVSSMAKFCLLGSTVALNFNLLFWPPRVCALICVFGTRIFPIPAIRFN